MNIALGSDHAGFGLKAAIATWLNHLGHSVNDIGPHELDPDDDYPDFAEAAALEIVAERSERGIILCGSGVGASITANKIPGIRAGMCHDSYSAHQGVEHDDMNVLCIGSRVVGEELIRELIQAFLQARFSGEDRHHRRLNKLLKVEARYLTNR
jgi:ribose 5-phosphate isomerase B